MKKLAVRTALASLLFALAGCGESAHVHTFAEEWSGNETCHWHAATCEHTELSKDLGDHVDIDSDGICDVCERKLDGQDFFVVVFVDGQTLLHDPIIVGKGEKVYRPSDPDKKGHDFRGWYDNPELQGDAFDFETPVTGNLTLYAKFNVCEYKITYLNDENIVHDDPSGYTFGVGVDAFDESACDSTGKDRFYGWYFDQELTKPATSITKDRTGDVELYAKRSEIFKITYENWPADIPNPNAVDYTAMEEVALDAGDMNKYPGFRNITFKEGDSQIDKIPLGSTGDKKVKVSYDLTETKVTFDPNGGVLVPDRPYVVIDFGEGIGPKKIMVPLSGSGLPANIYDQDLFPVPEKEGYCFGGYYLDEGLTTRLSETSENVLTCGSTVYAKWDKIPEGWKGQMPYSLDESLNLPEGHAQVEGSANLMIPYYVNNEYTEIFIYSPLIYDGSSCFQVTMDGKTFAGNTVNLFTGMVYSEDTIFASRGDTDFSECASIEIHYKLYRIDGTNKSSGSFKMDFSKGENDSYRQANLSVSATTGAYEESYRYWDIPSISAERPGYLFAGWFDEEGNRVDFDGHWAHTESEIKVKASWLAK